MLEVIDKGQTSDEHRMPLMFVHGGCHAAWCWDEHFLDYFADNGFRAIAPSWRGHGASSSSKPLYRCSINDYLADVRTVADGLDTPPIPIGHSVGGFLVQKYLERRTPPAGVLMASTPPTGILRTAARMWRRHPLSCLRANTIGEAHEIFSSPRLTREHLFSPSTPEEVIEACADRVESDSVRAVLLGQVFGRPKTKRVTTPLLVLGGMDDGMISNDEVRATGRAYGVKAELFPRMGHNMMMEPGWLAVADRIRKWLTAKGL